MSWGVGIPHEGSSPSRAILVAVKVKVYAQNSNIIVQILTFCRKFSTQRGKE